MKLREWLTGMAKESGIELDEDDFDSIGLVGDDPEVDLSDVLPGKASGQVELFLATPTGSTVEDGDLIWEPIARAGQWALRPDGKGGKKRIPLKIVAGRSKNQRREIGLQDVVDAFDDEAIEHVTVPETHENKPTENHGYIKGLKIVEGKFKGTPTKFLMGAYDFTEPATKDKVRRGSVPSRSAGFLYDYERTDTGKRYAVVLEHVALTPKPWLRGMPRFGRKLEAADDLPIATLTLADEGPTEVEYTEALEQEQEEADFLAESKPEVEINITNLTDPPDPLQVAQALRHERSEKKTTDNEPPRGGGNMAGNDTGTFQLSDEARAEMQKLQDELDAQKKRNETLSEQVDKLVGTANVNSTAQFIAELKTMGLSEERGFSGMLVEIEQVMLADDGGAALQAEHFADDKNKDGVLTVSDAMRRVFGALKTAEGSTLKLGEAIPSPTEKLDDPDAPDGKPPKGNEDVDLSDKSDAEILAMEDPEYLKKLGIPVDKVASNSNGGETK
jgi:hypothetical protein